MDEKKYPGNREIEDTIKPKDSIKPMGLVYAGPSMNPNPSPFSSVDRPNPNYVDPNGISQNERPIFEAVYAGPDMFMAQQMLMNAKPQMAGQQHQMQTGASNEPVEKTCPVCKITVKTSGRFCPECGSILTVQPTSGEHEE